VNRLDTVLKFEEYLKTLPQIQMVTTHDFCNGIYARSLHIPAGSILTGAVHKDESFFLVRQGSLLVTPDNESSPVGPGFMCVTKPMTKRAIVALEDSIITTFHPNVENETDLEKIWEKYTISVSLDNFFNPQKEVE